MSRSARTPTLLLLANLAAVAASPAQAAVATTLLRPAWLPQLVAAYTGSFDLLGIECEPSGGSACGQETSEPMVQGTAPGSIDLLGIDCEPNGASACGQGASAPAVQQHGAGGPLDLFGIECEPSGSPACTS